MPGTADSVHALASNPPSAVVFRISISLCQVSSANLSRYTMTGVFCLYVDSFFGGGCRQPASGMHSF